MSKANKTGIWFSLLVAVSILLSGCSTSVITPSVPASTLPIATVPATQTSTARIAPTMTAVPGSVWKSFTSKRYGYSLTYPSNWAASAAVSDWKRGDLLDSFKDGSDTFADLAGDANVAVGSQSLPGGTTLDSWSAANAALFKSTYMACEAQKNESTRLAGESAILLSYECKADGYYFIQAYSIHGQTGFAISWHDNNNQEPADRKTFEQFLSGFSFAK